MNLFNFLNGTGGRTVKILSGYIVMKDIEKLKIQIAKLEGYVNGIGECTHMLACDIDNILNTVDEIQYRNNKNPVTAFLKKKAPDDWKEQEKKAIEMERDKEYQKLLRKPPNCS